MFRILTLAACLCWLTTPAFADEPKKETDCSNHIDDDGDTMVDCADADCREDPACKAGQGPENTDATCSDWIDNDGDGLVDCDDPDCEGPGIQVCKGSAGVGGKHTAKSHVATPIPASSASESRTRSWAWNCSSGNRSAQAMHRNVPAQKASALPRK